MSSGGQASRCVPREPGTSIRFALLDDQPSVVEGRGEAFCGGWFGYLGYELGRRLEPVGPSLPRDVTNRVRG